NNPTGHPSHRITARMPDQRKHSDHDRKDNSHLADGWHMVGNFSTGESPFGDGATWFAFTETLEGGVPGSSLAGPVCVIQSVAVPKDRQSQPSQAAEIARLLKGRIEDETVYFEFGRVEIELWLGPAPGGWSLARLGHRDDACSYGYGKDDRAGTVASAVMGDLKTGDLPGPGRDQI
ncbi:hypothetical protein, partial [Streptomyces sp. NPDC051546]|uniref:hypothetical protein n=1 Tax=Streptomyces sp. NPDC051546 TaxID=3365655 RepID=UPI0037985BCC